MGYVTKPVDDIKIGFSTEDLSIIVYVDPQKQKIKQKLNFTPTKNILNNNLAMFIKYSGLTKSDFSKFFQPLIEQYMEGALAQAQILEDYSNGKTIGIEYREDGLVFVRSENKIYKAPTMKVIPGGKEMMKEFLISIRKEVLKN